MSGLDKKLEEILSYPWGDTWASMDEKINEIKQAFIDEGWLDSKQIGYPEAARKAVGLMTGQEWYDKWSAEFMEMAGRLYPQTQLELHAIAKKAAGIK